MHIQYTILSNITLVIRYWTFLKLWQNNYPYIYIYIATFNILSSYSYYRAGKSANKLSLSDLKMLFDIKWSEVFEYYLISEFSIPIFMFALKSTFYTYIYIYIYTDIEIN